MEKNTRIAVIGGVGIGGIALLAVLMRKPAGISVNPAPAPASLQYPQYPVAQIESAPINAVDAPTFNTFNFPADRNIQPPDTGDKCKCKGNCQSYQIASVARVKDAFRSVRSASIVLANVNPA